MNDPSRSATSRLKGLRTNALAALVMLVLEYGLGIAVNLYAILPKGDHGQGVLGAFAAAITGGPIVLTIHALLGTLLLVTAAAAVIRASLARRSIHIALAAGGLLAIVVAWLAGASFVGDGSNGSSMGMAMATGVALICYLLILFIAPTHPSVS